MLQGISDLLPTTQWVSYGIVDAQGAGDEKPITFDKTFGPLVDVKLQPSADQVRCRVSSWCAGRGEGSYYPFIDGDEVLVVMPEGSGRGNPVIIGRLNNEIDAFPTVVAANEPSGNKFGFERIRAPYVVEFAAAYVMRNAITGSLLNFGADGTITAKDGYSDVLHMGPDFVGLQATDDTSTSPFAVPGSTLLVLQLNKQDACIDLQIQGSTQLKLTKENSFLASNGTFTVQTAGMPIAAEHVITTEATLNLLNAVLTGLGALSLPGALAGLLDPVTRSGILAAAIAYAAAPATGAILPPVAGALTTAMLAKLPNPTGLIPGVGCPGFLAT